MTPRPPPSTLFPYTTLFRSGIMAAKRTSDLIPLCHPLPLSGVELDLVPRDDHVEITARVRTRGDRKSTRLNSSHVAISYAVFCLKKKTPHTRPQHAYTVYLT